MDVAKLLAELHRERQQIMETILSLERLDSSREPEMATSPAMTKVTGKRRGRPSGSKNKAKPKSARTQLSLQSSSECLN